MRLVILARHVHSHYGFFPAGPFLRLFQSATLPHSRIYIRQLLDQTEQAGHHAFPVLHSEARFSRASMFEKANQLKLYKQM